MSDDRSTEYVPATVELMELKATRLGCGRVAIILAMVTAIVAMLTATVVTVLREDRIEDLSEDAEKVASDLRQERTEDDTELSQERCEAAYARALAREVEAVDEAVLDAFRVGAAQGTPEYDAIVATFDVAQTKRREARQARDQYVADGRPLPCPID
jgi:hypothetical protein